jgi:hypothetical protein
MNKSILGFAIAIALAIAAIAQSPASDSGNSVGRYQLLSGEHEFISLSGSVKEKVILRLDTVTGKTSEWIQGKQADGSSGNLWSPI